MLQFTQQDVVSIRKRAKVNPQTLENLRRQCEFFFHEGVKVPQGTQSTWIMYYECPVDSAKLIYDYAKDNEYVCPACGRVYSGDPYSGSWWRYTVEKVVDGGFLCAVLWMITQEERYLKIATEVLERFATNYPMYELHGGIPYNNPGKINSQTLCEALTLRSLCMNFDIIQDALPAQLRTRIVKDLLTPSAQVLVEQRMNQLHNHEVVIDSALGIAGLLLGNESYMNFAVESKYGLRYQMQHGVLADGFWFEGTVHYHYFALYAFMLFEKFAHGTNYSLRELGIYEKMFAMPLHLMQPNFQMPCLGDGGDEGMFEELADHYEYPYGLFDLSFMAQILNKVYSVHKRNGVQALLYGKDTIEPTPQMVLSNYHDNEASGLTILRGAREQYLLFKHGKFGGEHDHYDKLGIHFVVQDKDVVDDFGTVGYAAPHHYPYFKNTFTHNTVCINGLNQPPANGQTIQYVKREDGVLIEGHADWCGAPPTLDSLTIEQWDMPSYEGVVMRRAILFCEDYFLEAFLVRGAKGRTVDWVIHPQGEVHLPEVKMEDTIVGSSQPQSFLHDAKCFIPAGVTKTCWSQPLGTLSVFSDCTQPSRLLYALGPNNPPKDTVCYQINRVEGICEDIVYMNLFAFDHNAMRITNVCFREVTNNTVIAELVIDGQKRRHEFSIGKER